MRSLKFVVIILVLCLPITAASGAIISPGASQTKLYLPLLQNKRVGVFVNHTSIIGKEHLIEFLLKNHIHITKIFVPEHGFTGGFDSAVNDSIDSKTQLPVISLYGKKLRPSSSDLANVDVIVFDIQDVGVRFYTYISSLQKLMEAALENNKHLIILDRPNPNGFYIDGPVLEPKYKSFTGMQPIPLVYGMTLGEYAKMLVGQEWLDVLPRNKAKLLKLTVIPCKNYTHKSLNIPPVKPSPNLPDIQSIYWYPSIGLLEGTVMSVGRGTDKPFRYIGHPTLATSFSFIPLSNKAASPPPYANLVCYGWDLSKDNSIASLNLSKQIQLKFLIQAYEFFPKKDQFFKKDFNFTSGNDELIKQIKAGMNEGEIRKSWEAKLNEFKKIRKKYLLYPDF